MHRFSVTLKLKCIMLSKHTDPSFCFLHFHVLQHHALCIPGMYKQSWLNIEQLQQIAVALQRFSCIHNNFFKWCFIYSNFKYTFVGIVVKQTMFLCDKHFPRTFGPSNSHTTCHRNTVKCQNDQLYCAIVLIYILTNMLSF